MTDYEDTVCISRPIAPLTTGRNGWFSHYRKHFCGSVFWTRANGEIVEITEALEEECASVWPDAINLGRVEKWHSGELLLDSDSNRFRILAKNEVKGK